MKSTALVLLVLSLGACRPGQPCPTCEDVADDPIADLGPVTDLPCGGADLQTDNRNCGSCGTECSIRFSGSEYGVGSCRGGECDPVQWMPKDWPEPTPLTCDDVCGSLWSEPLSCVAQGCADLTALVCGSIMGQPCQLFQNDPADVEFAGACDEPVPWPDEVFGDVRVVYCCCEP